MVADVEPLLVPVADAFRAIGIGKSKGYEMVREGELRTVKIGSKTLVPMSVLKQFAAELAAKAA